MCERESAVPARLYRFPRGIVSGIIFMIIVAPCPCAVVCAAAVVVSLVMLLLLLLLLPHSKIIVLR